MDIAFTEPMDVILEKLATSFNGFARVLFSYYEARKAKTCETILILPTDN